MGKQNPSPSPSIGKRKKGGVKGESGPSPKFRPPVSSRRKGGKGSSEGESTNGGKPLVIVESPTKARTITRYLRGRYRVMASGGHILDLPETRLGVDVNNDFEPTYIELPDRKKIIKALREAAQGTSEVYLATDPDREGEAIAYHITRAIGRDADQVHRVEFHEITGRAVEQAFRSSGKIDMRRVEAQQARRVMDRLVGYQVSPLLWKTVARGLSAGRVQSVALRLICEREKEIEDFVSQEYWTIDGEFITPPGDSFIARLVEWKGEKIVVPDKAGNKPTLPDQSAAEAMVDNLRGDRFTITLVEKKLKHRPPPPPYTTSTLQQEANRKSGLSTREIMAIAQRLYEGVELGDKGQLGLITYMRTDSTRISPEANARLRKFIGETMGQEALHPSTRIYKNKKGNVQDAHEAIRPTDVTITPQSIKTFLKPSEFMLYDLIWRRFVATQMKDAVYEVTTVEVSGDRGSLFRAKGSVIVEPGFTALYPERLSSKGEKGKEKKPDSGSSSEQPTRGEGEPSENGDNLTAFGSEGEDVEVLLPKTLQEGSEVEAREFIPTQHFTQPPPRFTESSLVRELDEKGIGRPSTYATIISTLLERKYVEKQKRVLLPTQLGRVVNSILVERFPQVFSVGFTAQMEQELDRIEEGGAEWREVVRNFYLPFSQALALAEQDRDQIKNQVETKLERACPQCGSPLVLRWAKNGRFIGCSQFPQCQYSEPYQDGEGEEVTSVPCPECGQPMRVAKGPYGKYLRCSQPQCKGKLPYTHGERCIREGCSGYIVAKRSKKGRTFYRCSNSQCDFITWHPPLDEPCPQCDAPTLFTTSSSKGTRKFCLKCRWSSREIKEAVK